MRAGRRFSARPRALSEPGVDIRLVPITEAGVAAEDIDLPPPALEILPATAAMYRSSGFFPPWIGYLAVTDGGSVGPAHSRRHP